MEGWPGRRPRRTRCCWWVWVNKAWVRLGLWVSQVEGWLEEIVPTDKMGMACGSNAGQWGDPEGQRAVGGCGVGVWASRVCVS